MNTERIEYSKSLPDYFTEDNKIDYELLSADARRYFPKMDTYVIHIAVLAYINEKLGRRQECTEEELKECINKYDNTTNVIETPIDETFDMSKTLKENNIIHN